VSKPRNVLLITADQFRGDALSALGHPNVRTPNLDRLAASGVHFVRHYAQASPCGPSRASLLTGLYMMNHRSVRNGTPLDARHATLPGELRKAGLAPTLFGYTDTSLDPRERDPADPALKTYEGVMPGFDVGLYMSEHPKAWLAYLEAQGYAIPKSGSRPWYKPDAKGDAGADRGATWAPAFYKKEHSETSFLTDAALRHLAHPAEPWFVHVSYIKPHPPFVATAPFHDAVDPAQVSLPARAENAATEAKLHPWLAWKLANQSKNGWTEAGPLDPARISDRDLRQLRATYFGMIAEVDEQIGRLLGKLEASGELDRTLVIFTSDHGELLGDHWMLGKDGWHDGAFHIPLIVRAPETPADNRGRRVTAFTEAVDVMPTILDWLGRAAPTACDGDSLMPWLKGESPVVWRTEAAWEYDYRDIAGQIPESALLLSSDQCSLGVIRGKRFKYVHFAGLPPILYDLKKDPGELRNWANDGGYAGVLLHYAQRMLTWRMLHADRGLSRQWLGPTGPIERTGPRTRA
jgi:arylsulfatase A-like enzyme